MEMTERMDVKMDGNDKMKGCKDEWKWQDEWKLENEWKWQKGWQNEWMYRLLEITCPVCRTIEESFLDKIRYECSAAPPCNINNFKDILLHHPVILII